VRAAATARPVAGRLLLALLAGVGAAGSGVALMATSAWLISRAAQQPPVLVLMVAIVAVRFFGIARGVFRYGERLAGHDAAFRWLADLRVDVYARLERLAPAGTSAFRSGDLLSRLVADVDALQDLWLRVLLPYGVAAVVGAAAVLLVGSLVPAAGLAVLLAVLGAAVLAPLLALGVARRAERAVAPARGTLAASTRDALAGAAELAAFGLAGTAVAQVEAADADLTRAERRSAAGAGVGSAVAAACAGAAVWAALALGVPAVRTGELPGVALAVVVLTPLALFELVGGLAPAAQQVPRVRAAARRVVEVTDAPDPVREPAAPAPLPPLPAAVEVERVRAGWPGGPDVLTAVDLRLPPGAHLGLVGPSGSGKSTLSMLLLRFLDPRAGTLRLGEVPYPQLAGDDVRRVVGLLAQDAHVFDTTVRENVLLARRDADEDALWAALDAARLGVAVRGWPEGLDTRVGEHGGQLSGGERQRLALARVLLAGFEVVVLDEPTEHLDEATALALLDDLLATTAGRSVLLVTHREPPAALAGVLAVRGGVVTPVGPPPSVLRGSEGSLTDG
jgi:ATP-binding cassette subfamily C protein CydC